ncbi:MAG: flagellar M-ring protein FliF [Cellvibrionales bacterium TMED49]|nr:flagellar M-ring protein FliF [Porticoccaceae bacterium]OUU36878.1 MAG: flagellar M-ring protein FliF [Cellvibrionales bacterium TMED49]
MATAAEPGTDLVADTPDSGNPVVATQATPKPNMLPVVSSEGIALPNIAEVLAQPAVRKAMPAIITLLTIAIFLIAYSVTREPPTRSLYPGLSEADRQTAFDALTSAEFYVRIDDQTGDLIVRDERYHEARIFLASRGLPQEGAAGGMGSLSEDASMTTSQFMEQVRYVSAMEQELAKSVAQISTIQAARVHLAAPKQSVFVRNRTPAKASVVVTPFPGRIISNSQVEAIIHMVSSSVPYLSADDVVVVDKRGKLLTDAKRFASMQLNSSQMEHKNSIEETYRSRIDALLSSVVGEENVRSEVDVTMDFTETEATFEEFDNNRNGPKARSEILTQENNSTMAAIGIPGSMNNTNPGLASGVVDGQLGDDPVGTDGSSSTRQTRNYELDRAVRHVKMRGGMIQRISVAVIINEREVEAPPPAAPVLAEGEEAPAQEVAVEAPGMVIDPYTDAELERFTNLVKGVVGFDQARGDVVTVVAAAFEKPVPIENLVKWYENAQVMSTARSMGAALTFIILLFVVVRPVLKSYLPQVETVEETKAVRRQDGELTEEELAMIQEEEPESLDDIKAKLKPKKSTISADMLDTANSYDDKVALVRYLVAEDAGRVANVIRKMIKVG